ncbi:FAD-dependent oxidoreductase [Psychrobacillus sp. NEAU-3TGS]|uniref:FAD-dependent oxidoreductase n=1 Tax=Psychrobacillus sp. NEAU-3TGS TaxID=2995412 RepID=UPI002497013A|nr:FAD-dependent oxidoreductase [Psychrobacillus sp. NEAU-3TGS]MDI2585989.1 FAD-dependent oxidoreductase [Psychrobacillus sp. NEAU-3TGS]
MTQKILPGESESYWLANKELPLFPKLSEDIEVDVAIVGAGLTGITAAYLLSQIGRKVIVIEGTNILKGTTGFTTAKVTAQHGPIYQQLINTFDEQKARLYYDANTEAKDFIQRTIEQLNIHCDFETLPAYIYADTEEGAEEIEKEMEAYNALGIQGATLTKDTGLPYTVKQALKLENQGQFHPIKYAKALMEKAIENGVQFFEESRAKTVKSNTVELMEGQKITANKILVCSHFPFNDGDGLYFARMHSERSYALASIAPTNYPKGMYINVEKPTRSVRTAIGNDGKRYLLIGGEGHVTGRFEGDTNANYETLAAFGREQFKVSHYDYRWSAQDLITLDQLPYVGTMTAGKTDVLVATGYAKWGMTNSTVAAKIMADLVLEKENRYIDLYNPARSKMKKEDIKSFAKNNASVAKELVKGKTEIPDLKLEDIQTGSGDIIMLDGKKVGAYKDDQGKVYLVKPACTHMGCNVSFNSAESSWDCPCHGSRFSYNGDVIEGPAFEPLEKVEYTD